MLSTVATVRRTEPQAKLLNGLAVETEIRIDLTKDLCSICRCELLELDLSLTPTKESQNAEKPSCDCDTSQRSCTSKDLDPQKLKDMFQIITSQTACAAAEEIADPIIRLLRCADHYFHLSCLKGLLAFSAANKTATEEPDWIRCPICLMIYGKKTGDQPPGTFEIDYDEHLECEGFGQNSRGTFIINYHFPNGVRSDGTPFRGTWRSAFVPNCPRGQTIVLMLQVAFERRVTFTVGTSLTTGQKNVVVWNSIHHKTSTSGGLTCYGYPDATYFDRVEQELAANGIFAEDISEEMRGSLEGLVAAKSKPLVKVKAKSRPTSKGRPSAKHTL